MSSTKKILLAEDSPQDAEMTLEALANYRLSNDVVLVGDGEEALDYLYARGKFAGRTDGDPLLVLLDLKMPKVDGLEVLRVIKSDPALRTLPVVMLTASREEQDVVKSYQLGVNAYVVKPVGFQKFVEAVRQIGVFWTIHNEPSPRP
jgi:two-component system, response regulator